MKIEQKKRLAGAAVIVMSSMIISRITGVVRDSLIANLGKNNSDVLITAFTASNIMYNLLVGGAIAAALIPVLSGFIVKNEEEEGWKAVGTFINITFLVSIGFCILGMVFSPQLVGFLGKAYSPEKAEVAVKLTRILFPSVGFLMLAGLTNGILYSYKRFSSAAYGPAIYNLGTILSILAFKDSGMEKVAMGILGSAIFYFIFQLSFAFKDAKFYRFKLFFNDPGFKKLLKLAIPSLIASSVVQINLLISQSYSSFYAAGSVTAYTNANNIWQFPYGIFAMGLGSAILPTLSEKLALGELLEFKRLINKSLKNILLFIVPSSVGFIVLGKPIVSAIYRWSSKFDASQIDLTSRILVFFTIALFAQSLLAIISRAYYAKNDTWTPLIFSSTSIVLNGLACYLLFKTTDLEAAGMSLAFSLSSAYYAITMMYILSKKVKGLMWGDLFRFFLRISLAGVLMGLVLFLLNQIMSIDFNHSFSMKGKLIELSILAFEVLAGIAFYFGLIFIMKVEEGQYILQMGLTKLKSISKKLRKGQGV